MNIARCLAMIEQAQARVDRQTDVVATLPPDSGARQAATDLLTSMKMGLVDMRSSHRKLQENAARRPIVSPTRIMRRRS